MRGGYLLTIAVLLFSSVAVSTEIRGNASKIVVTHDEDPDGKGPLPKSRKTLLEVEPHRLELIALVGRVHITSDATLFCLREGIGVAWFGWNGETGTRCGGLQTYGSPAQFLPIVATV